MKTGKKKFAFKGRQILLFGLVALVITAGYYRWTIERESLSMTAAVNNDTLPKDAENKEDENKNENNESTVEKQNESDLSALRRERDAARSQSVEEWKKITQSSDTSAEGKKEAESKIAKATENADKERKIETMVKAKGYEDCFAYVDGEGVSVTVKGGEIDGSKVAQIKDIIVTETNVSARNIRINAL